MSNYSIVSNVALTATADAIRTKSGSQATIEFDNNTGFKDAVDAIPTGGGGITADDLATNTEPSGAISLGVTVTEIGANAFANKPLASVTGQYVTKINESAFNSCKSLVSAIFPLVSVFVGGNIFRHCENLETIRFPELVNAGSSYQFNNCPKLLIGVFPKLTSAGQSFRISSFATLDFASKISIGNYWFTDCGNLDAFILRSTEMCPLTNIGGLNGTPFASGNAGGTLYVPSALISSYQSDTNWSTILGYANNQIKSIESTHTDPNAAIDLTLYYADGTPIPTT